MERDVVYEGMDTPWGAAQTATVLAPGIGIVDTAGHGGIKLSRERNARVPEYLRRAGGWYEEDCEASIPLVIFDEALRANGPAWLVASLDKTPASDGMRRWYPDEYERWFNVKLKPGESWARDERVFHQEHAADLLVISACGDWQAGVPKGFVGVVARVGGRSANSSAEPERWFLVPADEYSANRKFSFIVDPARHQEVADFTKGNP